MRVRDGKEELGRLFFVHGHQGTLDSDRLHRSPGFWCDNFWRPIQRVFKISVNTPAKDFELRYEHDSAPLFLVTGPGKSDISGRSYSSTCF